MQGSRRLILSMPTVIKHGTASQTEQEPGTVLAQDPLIPPLTSRVAFCAWPICPTTRLTG
jgi:hypothetical protein